MKITPLQKLLTDEAIDLSLVREAIGRSRTTIWRWREARSYPDASTDVPKLIELYREHGLDYNGCYEKSVEIEADEL